MTNILQTTLDTSEVWALFLPLGFLLFKKISREPVREIILYLWVALVLNLAIVIVSFLPDFYSDEELKSMPFLLQNNTIEYNLHSFIRVTLFTLFFIRNSKDSIQGLRKILLVLFYVFAAVNFIYFESVILLFSSRLFTVESIVLLFFCIYYFLNAILQEKNEKLYRGPFFWVVTGIAVYESINFLIFLLYKYLINNYTAFAQHIWNLHNISFIILCLFITKAFYESRRR